jgi:multiple sugar transport system permease protein
MERRSPLYAVLVHCTALLLGVFVLAPIVWLFVMSISSTPDLTAKPLHWWPQTIDFSRYRTLVTAAANSTGQAFLASLRNSLAVAGCLWLFPPPGPSRAMSRSAGRFMQ